MLQIFSVRDTAAEAFLPPFTMNSRGAAIRAFTDAVNGGNNQFTAHAGDYNLFHIGDFDEDLGVVTPSEPVLLGNGLSFVASGPFLDAESEGVIGGGS